jgi:hypothetical protein
MKCRATYAPLERNDTHCSKCDPGLAFDDGPCRLSTAANPHHGWPAMLGIPVCAPCMRDPRKRVALINALVKGQGQRQAANPIVPEPLPPEQQLPQPSV